jgi:hypothetical protein
MAATFRTDDQNSNTFARFPVQVLNQVTTFTNADGTTAKKIAQGDTTVLGSKISKILVTTTEVIGNTLKLWLHDGTSLSTLPITFVGIPANSGDGSTTANCVSVLRSTAVDPCVELDNNGNPYLLLSKTFSIYASVSTAVASTKTLQVSVWIDDY